VQCGSWYIISLSRLNIVIFLAQWLRSVERDGIDSLTEDDIKHLSLIKELIFDADPEADSVYPLSALLLSVWADSKCDGVSVYGSIFLFTQYINHSSSTVRQSIPLRLGAY
jgi:hypothetical protein